MKLDSSEPAARMPDGFLHRGAQVTRLEAFVDAAFAFAVTLLVISIDAIPDSLDSLIQALKGIPAFAASFAMIALFWAAHARWSKRYGLDDAASTVLSLALVFLVLVYVYPLKLLFGTFFGWITGGWLPYQMVVAGYGDIAAMFVVYGAAFATLSLCLYGLYLHAWHRREPIGLEPAEREATYASLAIYLLFAAVGLVSVLVALLMPADPAPALSGLPGLVYIFMWLASPTEWLARRWYRRRSTRASTLGAT